MPEAGVLAFFGREIKHYADKPGQTSKLPPEHPKEHVPFCLPCFNNWCKAEYHQPDPDDPHLLSLPTAKLSKKGSCQKCNPAPPGTYDEALIHQSCHILEEYNSHNLNGKHAAEIMNELKPTGHLHCAIQGKELVIGIGEYVLHICFSTEAHTFWIPTTLYQIIINGSTLPQGEEGHSFPGRPFPVQTGHSYLLTISVLSLFMCFVFVILALQLTSYPNRHFGLASGVVIMVQFTLWTGLDNFRDEIVSKAKVDYVPIWQTMKDCQDVFNGFGAHESCDALWITHIHPRMPTSFVCQNDDILEPIPQYCHHSTLRTYCSNYFT
ncbi:hypothetical protein K435DRAFT_877954 [Dendrothele bispora CBS 962.96]|uniref:Uncharacterized protein n=1 Tax=Dendrothele bispora (strain CBS 962.96) TaxID=1314807 RepID=A0A4V4HAY9_DENBC|nr:hypothetical protein K435DRAFT_877954 [Dendrothele bispora CBS 962.96]